MAIREIMVDLETLGRRPGCKILSIGAVVFSPEGLGDEFYVTVTTDDQPLAEDLETVRWWQQQSPEARKVFDAPRHDFMLGMSKWRDFVRSVGGKRSVAIWGNGADFDNAILQICFDVVGLEQPWEFWNNRCYRTLKNLPGAPKMQKRSGTHHNALDDAKTQAEHAVEIHKALKLWPSA